MADAAIRRQIPPKRAEKHGIPALNSNILVMLP
jgi:hypothetical protein